MGWQDSGIALGVVILVAAFALSLIPNDSFYTKSRAMYSRRYGL